MTLTQANRAIQFDSPLGKDKLLFHNMSGSEELGGGFQYDVELLSDDSEVDLDKVLGKAVTITLQVGDTDKRYFNGIVASFMQDGILGDLTRYRAIVRPWTWLLTRTADCRIFQQKDVSETVQAVFKENGFTDFKVSLNGKYEKREFCVQYRESDHDFVTRLLEEEGIYTYFEHTEDKHTLVLADAASAHKPIKGYEEIPFYPLGDVRERDHIFDWSVSREVQPGKWATTAYDFEKPKADLTAKASVDRKHDQAKFEYFMPATYLKVPHGEAISTTRINEWQAQHETNVGAADARGISPGALFKLTQYPRKDQNREYLVTSARYEMEGDDYQNGSGSADPFRCTFTTISSKEVFRPLRRTTKPLIQGPQTAVVVGKKGEEIWTDKYGRIKLQFHWDRYGKGDENSSCWVRVAQTWAGKKFGALATPRIGQEVIVEFLEGDPDQPIVTGSVYNADQMPPYKLPDDASQSGIKTRSTKKGNEKTFNELRFEDKKGEEEVYFQAEKNFNRVVKNNDTLKVGFETKDAGDQTIDVYNDCTLTIEKGKRTVTIKELDDILEVAKGNQTVDIKQGNQTVDIKQGNQETSIALGDHSLKLDAGGSTIEAMKSIELKVGASSIKIDPTGITMQASRISTTGMQMVSTKAPMVSTTAFAVQSISAPILKITGAAMALVKGGLVKLN